MSCELFLSSSVLKLRFLCRKLLILFRGDPLTLWLSSDTLIWIFVLGFSLDLMGTFSALLDLFGRVCHVEFFIASFAIDFGGKLEPGETN